MNANRHVEHEVTIHIDSLSLKGTLTEPEHASVVVIFAHGSGSGRFSPRNRFVAQRFQESGFATLLLDLLTGGEQEIDETTAEFRFDIPLLSARLVAALDWAAVFPSTRAMQIALYGASTGAAAALIAAARRPDRVRGVISRGGRVDLAGTVLSQVQAPVLMVVGGDDPAVQALNHQAKRELPGPCQIEVIEGAGHLFEEPGAMDEVARLSLKWLREELMGGQSGREAA